ncbi:MAG TPA: ABC transporter ATP-binding protein [Candidatus Latescibacteria bacterium]|nr:ABC transporter ATP-binding protein [Candidatus Latescibacterota bacterium]
MTDRVDTPRETVLKAHGIRKVFRTGTTELEVLKGVSLEVRRGEMIAITGASGVGKSTLLHILGTLDRPSEGELEINAEDVLSLDSDSLAQFRNRHIGFVFQFHNLLPEFTALENVMLPGMIGSVPVAEVRDQATELLASVGLEERFDHRPGELSGGECQRVAVVRALAMNPLVVFADEPSGNLDVAASNALHEMIVELSRSEKQTFMVMTHDQNLAQSLDRTGHIEAGVLHLS